MRITCMKCGRKGHFTKCCQTKGAGNFAKSKKTIKAPAQRIRRKDEWEDSSSDSVVEDEKIVLTIDGDKNGQFSLSQKKWQPIQNDWSPYSIMKISNE